MNASSLACAIALILVPAAAAAGSADWQRYVIAKTGAAVEIPVSILSEDAELPDGGLGRRFYTNDHRADMRGQSLRHSAKDPHTAFLRRQRRAVGTV